MAINGKLTELRQKAEKTSKKADVSVAAAD